MTVTYMWMGILTVTYMWMGTCHKRPKQSAFNIQGSKSSHMIFGEFLFLININLADLIFLVLDCDILYILLIWCYLLLI